MDIPTNDDQHEPDASVIVKQVSMTTRIHETLYTLESRVVKRDDGTLRSEYRVLLKRDVIKDWTEGDVAQYFGLDIY